MSCAYQSALAKKEAAKERKEKRQKKVSDGLWSKENPDMIGCHISKDGTLVKGGKPRKKKSPTLSKLKKMLWDEVRFVVYAESPDRCISCGSDAPPVACHICPSNEGAIIRFFLPAIYRGCRNCNGDEMRHRGRWRGKFEDIFGKDFVDALYLMSEEESRKEIAHKFQVKKWWVLEQIERMRKLRGNPTK